MTYRRNRSPLTWTIRGLALGLACSLAGTAHATGTTELPFDMPALSTLQASNKLVFAHYFTPFPVQYNNAYPDSTWNNFVDPPVGNQYYPNGGYTRQQPLQRAALPKGVDWEFEDHMHQVRSAEAAGIDVWTIYLGGYQTNTYNDAVVTMNAVAAASDHFKVALSPDMSSSTNFGDNANAAANFENAIKGLATYAAAFSAPAHGNATGGIMVTPFLAENKTAQWYVDRFNAIKSSTGIDIAFVPMLLNGSNLSNFTGSTALNNSGYLYGATQWNGFTTGQGVTTLNNAHNAGLVYMNAVVPDSVRPKSMWYDEVQNTTTYRTDWTNSLQGGTGGVGAEWTHVVTWQDFSEGSEAVPATSKTYVPVDLTAYYATWYKTGERPEIVRDAFYGVYRSQSTQATPVRGNLSLNTGTANYNQIEMLAFVKDIPAGQTVTLQVDIAGHHYSKTLTQADINASGGLYSYKVPLPVGLTDATADAPVFTLIRNGVIVSQQTGYWDVNDNITVDDFLYKGQSSLRPNPFTINQFALSAAYRWTNPNAATNPNSSNYDAAFDTATVKLRIQEDRSPFPRLTNDQAMKYTDTSSSHGSQGGMGYSFNKTIDNATGGTPPTSAAFDFNVLDAGDTGTGALQPMAKLSNASSSSTTITDGVILKLFADDGAGHHVLAYQNSGGSFILLPDLKISADKWYRVLIDFGSLSTTSDKFNLTLVEAGGSVFTWNNLTFRNNVSQLTQLTLFNNATDASLGSFALDNVYVGTSSAPIPEPATLGLLTAGAGLLLGRRRRV